MGKSTIAKNIIKSDNYLSLGYEKNQIMIISGKNMHT